MAKVLLLIVGCGALLGVIAACVVAWVRYRTLLRPGLFLLVALGTAVAVFTLTTDWLMTVDAGRTSHSDDVRTGGIAAAAVLALYGLWLNDRRRRTDEDRGETERERTAGERFARAIELLGNADEAVKLGALHSLAMLGRGWPDLVQPVLDVLCAYLRMPFRRDDPTGDRLRQVRMTAQRLIQDMLSISPADDRVLDLSGAVLHDFSLRSVTVQTLVAEGSIGVGRTTFDGLRVTGKCDLAHAWFEGPVGAVGATFDTLTLSDARFEKAVDLSLTTIGSSVAAFVKFDEGVDLTGSSCERRFRWRIDAGGPLECAESTFRDGMDIAGSTIRSGRTTFQNAWLGDRTNFDNVSLAAVDLRASRLPDGFNPQQLESRAESNQIDLANQLERVQIGNQRDLWEVRRRVTGRS
jgi:uncharacterized protein YjbI with pentapeptide repeats